MKEKISSFLRKFTRWLVAVILLLGGAITIVKFYPYIFSKTIHGEIVKVERVNRPDTVISTGGGSLSKEQMFSFAIAIKDETGAIHTASSEDRQWAVAEAGKCAEAKIFPYPPWELDRAGTYHGARLIKYNDCPSK